MQTLPRSSGVGLSRQGCKSFNLCVSREDWWFSCRGSASFCNQKKQVLVNNLQDGYDLYRFERKYPTHLFKVPTTQLFAIAKQVVFAEDLTIAVGGSDNGHVHVFCIANSKEIQILKHVAGTVFFKCKVINSQWFKTKASTAVQVIEVITTLIWKCTRTNMALMIHLITRMQAWSSVLEGRGIPIYNYGSTD